MENIHDIIEKYVHDTSFSQYDKLVTSESVYRGPTKNGKPHGYGIRENQSSLYIGHFRFGKPYGKGLFITENSVTIGTFKNSHEFGYIEHTSINQNEMEYYKIECLKSHYTGYGEHGKNKNKFIGNFVNSRPVGFITMYDEPFWVYCNISDFDNSEIIYYNSDNIIIKKDIIRNEVEYLTYFKNLDGYEVCDINTSTNTGWMKRYNNKGKLIVSGHLENGRACDEVIEYDPLDRYIFTSYFYSNSFQYAYALFNKNHEQYASITASKQASDFIIHGWVKDPDTLSFVYDGDIILYHYEGNGKLIDNDGNIYEGHFNKSKYDGFGILKDKNDNLIYEGEFSNGKYIKEGIEIDTNIKAKPINSTDDNYYNYFTLCNTFFKSFFLNRINCVGNMTGIINTMKNYYDDLDFDRVINFLGE